MLVSQEFTEQTEIGTVDVLFTNTDNEVSSGLMYRLIELDKQLRTKLEFPVDNSYLLLLLYFVCVKLNWMHSFC